MYLQQSTQSFYENLPKFSDFSQVADPRRYVPLPDDWVVGVADIVGSTHHIARGRYKVVNVVGAAVISAQINAADQAALPYVFGGDGAHFAVWPSQRAAAERALDAVRRWARREYQVELRVATVTVGALREAGRDVRVARFAASEGVDYAMFSGGGLAYAEARMKAGLLSLREPIGDVGLPMLDGLSCRWSNVRSARGAILSVVAEPTPGVSEEAFAEVAQEVLAAVEAESRPMPENGPDVQFPPPGMTIEARVLQKGSFVSRLAGLFLSNALIWSVMKSGLRLGRFDPKAYRAEVSANADFRKFDDGLKMTLDCDAAAQARIERVLSRAQEAGLIRYGLHAQDEAMMTCFVPSPTEADHVHFVDGAAGGYALAAAQIKA